MKSHAVREYDLDILFFTARRTTITPLEFQMAGLLVEPIHNCSIQDKKDCWHIRIYKQCMIRQI